MANSQALTAEQQENINKAEDALEHAKVQCFFSRSPTTVFITAVGFQLQTFISYDIPTAATNGKDIAFNPDFLLSLTPEERVFLYLHEVWHVCHKHTIRVGNRDKLKWNHAADYVINDMLKNEGYQMPSDGLYDPNYTEQLGTEAIYDLLPDIPQNEGFVMDLMPDGMSDPEAGNNEKENGGGGGEGIESEIDAILVTAKVTSDMSGTKPGSLPGSLEIYLDKLMNPKLPWNTILQNYLFSFVKDDYSYQRPNKRFAPDYYLPSAYSEGLGEICVAVDSSGSVSDEEFRAFISEIEHIRQTMHPSKTTILDFDTSIKDEHVLLDGAAIDDVSFHGRGGTDLFPVIKRCNKMQPEFLIVFSDLDCQQIPKEMETDYPVIWICVNNKRGKVQFGELIHLEL